MGSGDPDLYKAFCWRFWHLIRGQGGRLGVVLPRSVFNGKGTSEFRLAVLSGGSITDLTTVINTGGWVFDDAERRYTIAMASIVKDERRPENLVRLRGPFSSLATFVPGIQQAAASFPVQEVLTWTDSAALPMLPGEGSAEAFAQLRKAPRLDFNQEGEWRARPYTELHATNDKDLMVFKERRASGYWPILKAEAFDIWDPDRGTYYAWGNPSEVLKHLEDKRCRGRRNERSAFFEFTDPRWFGNPDTLPCMRPRVAFHDVARNTDTRTVKVALVPPKVFLTHLVPHFLWPRGDEKDEAYLLGVLSSIPLDWYARRFVELHLTYDVFNSFPIPRPGRDNPLWQRVVQLAGRLASPDDRFAEWAAAVGVECGPIPEPEKDAMIFELDAVVAHLYGLTEAHVRHIFETFHEGWDYHARLDAVLRCFRQWEGRR
jgi:hypothetical protein